VISDEQDDSSVELQEISQVGRLSIAIAVSQGLAVLRIEPEGLDNASRYLTCIMKSSTTPNVLFVFAGPTAELVEEFVETRPSLLMNALTENVEKTEFLLISARKESRAGSRREAAQRMSPLSG
jgi:hypothetical protein